MASVVDELIDLDAFAHGTERDELFMRSMREAFSIHYQSCEEFRAFMKERGFSSPQLPAGLAFEDIPFIFVNVFKERDMLTGPRGDVVIELTSSGTGGRKSRNFLDRVSLERIKRIARNVYDALGMVAPGQKVNYILFSYDPRVAGDLGTAFTDDLLTSFTDVGEVFYTIRFDKEQDDFFFDLEGTISTLERFAEKHAERGEPVRLLGFPAFIHRVLNTRGQRGAPALDLGENSWALTGGGWKTEEGRAIPRSEFARLCRDMLGFPASNVRDLFGMVEHGVPYVQCEMGSFHVPVYGQPLIRHPLKLTVQPAGETGLLQLMTPYFTSYPAISILTSDLARLGPVCPCGRGGPTIEFVGRGGLRKHKGCAIQAAELLA